MRYVLLCVKVSRDDQQKLSTSGGGGRTEDWAGEEMTSGTGRGETLQFARGSRVKLTEKESDRESLAFKMKGRIRR